MLLLPQKQEIFADLLFAQAGRVRLKMLSQFAHHPHVFVLGDRSIIFEFDKLLILSDRRIVSVYHKGAAYSRMGANAASAFVHEDLRSRMVLKRCLLLPRSGSVQRGYVRLSRRTAQSPKSGLRTDQVLQIQAARLLVPNPARGGLFIEAPAAPPRPL